MAVRLLASLVTTLLLVGPASAQDLRRAVLAGGCFWCIEADFDKVDGVVKTTSGYTGGSTENPTYEQVSKTDTGHYEAVEIIYDPSVVTYDQLLHTFFRSIDPTDAGGQFCDRGDSYRSAVFVTNQDQATVAAKSKSEAAQALGRSVVTPILAASSFWPAEEYHQNYHNKRPLRYTFYRKTCGRDARVREVWGNQAGGS